MTAITDRIIELEDEFNSLFINIVKSYAKTGHTMRATAITLEIDPCTFNKLMRRHGWQVWFVRGKQKGVWNKPLAG